MKALLPLLPLPLGEGRLGGPAVQCRPDVCEAIQLSFAGTVARFLHRVPCFVRFEIFRPEGERAALSWPDGIDRAAAIPKDAVSVSADAQARRSVEVLEHVFIPELAEGKFEPAGDAIDLRSAWIDATGLRASTAVVTLLAVKTKSALVERLGHVFGDNTT